MIDASSKPENTPWISSYMIVRDVDQAADFYKKAFHFNIRELAPGEDGTTWHAELTYKDQLVMLGKEGAWNSTTKSPVTNGITAPISLYVYTENVDEFHKHAIAHHAKEVSPPSDMFWGDRMCQLKDLDGYIWCFASPSEDQK
jgi:uncharacterized glyoxalase superfamily protein PhnB